MALEIRAARVRDRNTVETPPAQAITHGSQLTTAMVGPRVAMTTASGSVSASSFGGSGVTITGRNFTGTFTADVACTLVDCQFAQPINNTAGVTVQLNYCKVSPATPQDWCIGPTKVSAYRCLLEGCSDGVRFDSMNLIENIITVKGQNSADHNDGVQMYLSSQGGQILRNSINAIPTNSAALGLGEGNACIFVADGSTGTIEIRDNLLTGGGYTLGLHESMSYRVTGNRVTQGSWGFGPVNTANAVPGAFLEWSDNQTTTGTVLTP